MRGFGTTGVFQSLSSEPCKAGYEWGLGSLFGTHPRVWGCGEKPGLVAKQSLHCPHGGRHEREQLQGQNIISKLPDAAEIRSEQLLGVALKEPGPTTGSPNPMKRSKRDLGVLIQHVPCSPIPEPAFWPPAPCLWWWQHWAGRVDGHQWSGLGVAAQPKGQDLAPRMVSGY